MRLDDTAGRTHRLPVAAPPHLPEQLERLLVAQGEHLAHRQGSGLGRQEEVGLVHGGLRGCGDRVSMLPGVAQIVSPPLSPCLVSKICGPLVA